MAIGGGFERLLAGAFLICATPGVAKSDQQSDEEVIARVCYDRISMKDRAFADALGRKAAFEHCQKEMRSYLNARRDSANTNSDPDALEASAEDDQKSQSQSENRSAQEGQKNGG